jgi:hypothetical protein
MLHVIAVYREDTYKTTCPIETAISRYFFLPVLLSTEICVYCMYTCAFSSHTESGRLSATKRIYLFCDISQNSIKDCMLFRFPIHISQLIFTIKYLYVVFVGDDVKGRYPRLI